MTTVARPAAHPAAPTVPQLTGQWSLRVLQAYGEDLDLVHRWMSAPHVAITWKQAWDKPRWARELAAQHAGAHSRPCLLSRQQQPLAYLEIYRVARDELSGHYRCAPDDLGVHVALGSAESLGRGLGSAALEEVSGALLRAEPSCMRVVAEPSAANPAALGAFAKAGFYRVTNLELPQKLATLMVRPRSGRREDAAQVAAT